MIVSSPHEAVPIPETSVTDFVLQRAHELGNKAALIDGLTGRTITYEQLPKLIRRLAAAFASYGFLKGDVLAIFSPNVPEYALSFHAIAMLGGATTMVPSLFNDLEIATQLRDSNAKFLLTVPPLLDKARAAAAETNVSQIFVLGEAHGAISFSSLLTNPASTPETKVDPHDDIAALPYSSGTTGFPKGVMLTHYNLVSMLSQLQANDAFNETDTLICVVPMYHLYGLHVVVNLGLSQGATIVTLPRYELNQFLKTLEGFEITVAPLVPPLVLTLSRAIEVDNYDLSNLKLIHCGAAPLPWNVAQACSRRLKCGIRYGYGLTEVSPLSHASTPSQPEKPGSVGYCLPNTECKIVDPAIGAELGANESGEIWVRGPQVMKGYLGNQEATSEMINSEGWLRTGDIGYVDEDGCLFVVDRLKELIKYKGKQVAPAELEAILLTHPAVADAGVIPSLDEEAGEIPKAFVVLKTDATADEIMEYVSERVAPHKRIREVEFVEAIPKSPAGKILRRVLVERERMDRSRESS